MTRREAPLRQKTADKHLMSSGGREEAEARSAHRFALAGNSGSNFKNTVFVAEKTDFVEFQVLIYSFKIVLL